MLAWFFEYPGNPINPAVSPEADGFYADWFVDIAEAITRAPLAAKRVPYAALITGAAHLIIATDKLAHKGGYTAWWDKDNPMYKRQLEYYSQLDIDIGTGKPHDPRNPFGIKDKIPKEKLKKLNDLMKEHANDTSIEYEDGVFHLQYSPSWAEDFAVSVSHERCQKSLVCMKEAGHKGECFPDY